jgi:LmbE family N-acetylglucosaminyl deacetylase
VLAFGAHPDDIEFGCGAVLAQETKRGAKVHLVVCTRGEAGTNGSPELRTREAETAAGILGASIEFCEMGGDAHLVHTPAHAIAFAKIIRRLRPEIVLAPTTLENQHPDHAVVGKLARDASRLARYGGLSELKDLPPHAIGQLLYFAITADAEPRDLLGVMIDVSSPGVVETWIRAMEAHASQLQTRNYVELQQARAKLNGLRCGAAYATTLYPNDTLVFGSVLPLFGAARRF